MRIRPIINRIISIAAVAILALCAAPHANAQYVNPISYSMNNGDTGTYNYWDSIYNGTGSTSTDNAPLSGGTGYLTSGHLPNPLWDVDILPNGHFGQDYQWVGWYSSYTPTITVTFNLGASTMLSSSQFYLDNGGSGGVGYGGVSLPSSVDLSFSNNGVTFGNPIDTPIAADNSNPDARWIDISTPVTAQYIQATFGYSNAWVFLGQARFGAANSAVPEPNAYALIVSLGLSGSILVCRRNRYK